MKEKLNGLDLFSGIGGNTLALREYINTIAYCEQDRHAQSVLLSRMGDQSIKAAPIWDDISTLTGKHFDTVIDIIVAGFPCQDISVAGKGAGILDGKRSGLFFEIMRLAEEIKPAFIFLENVPAIRTRGMDRVLEELTKAGYDSRWCMLSAQEVGAPHKRERWFCLAYSISDVSSQGLQRRRSSVRVPKEQPSADCICEFTPWTKFKISANHEFISANGRIVKPTMGRGIYGVPSRMDRIKRLGNAVVPMQAEKAFEYLMGIST